MPLNRDNVIMIIGAVLICIIQVTLAPYMTIAYATPNFMLAYAAAIAVIRPSSSRVAILAFAMGLLYNLLLGGPVGALAIALILTCLVSGRTLSVVANGTQFMPLSIMVVAILATEVIYGFLTFMATGIGLGDVMLMRVAPCFVYDAVLGLILYFVMSRLAAEPDGTVSIGGPTLLR